GFSRPVVVTDAFLSAQGTVARLVAALTDAGCEVSVFDGTVPDPTTDSLGPGLAVVRAHGADCVIGLGGGSPLDTAKALAVLAAGG
ncbi:iron-containing alcohol dehydrogenase, partial [Mycobacterium kansasii]